jgi:hypothetical protein
MEIIDYFFEGVIGYEVWGKQRPEVLKRIDEYQQKVDADILGSESDMLYTESLPGADADGIKFLNLDITVEAPIVIFPVQYRSPQHLRFDLDRIRVTNEFNGKIELLQERARYIQWYNNCNINFDGLKEYSQLVGYALARKESQIVLDALNDSGTGRYAAAVVDLSTGKITGCEHGSKTHYHELGHIEFNNTEWGAKIDYYQYFFMMVAVFFGALSLLIDNLFLHLFTFLNALGMLCSYVYQEIWAWAWCLREYNKKR